MNVNVYDRADNFVRVIAPSQLLVFVHTDELNGEDSVHISTLAPLAQGERLVWMDRYGAAHEHVCQNPKVTRELGTPIYSDTAINSICDTFGDMISTLDASGRSAAAVFQQVIKQTRFTGSCEISADFPAKTVLSRKTARECIREVLKLGGDLETKITASAGGVVARECNIVEYRGHTGGHKRFTYGKDLVKVERTEHSAVITACYGYGKTIETKGEGEVVDKPRLTVYVTDEDARAKYGIGGRHLVGKYENTQCDDQAQLEREVRAYLKARSRPQVTYEADVVDLASMGREWEGVGVGDSVDIVDTCFSPALRCRGRVAKIVRNVLADTATVTLGNVTDTLADQFMTEREHLQSLQTTLDNLGEPDPRKDSYLKKLMEGLNRKFNENGANYYHIDFHTGSTWASVPMDENGKPTREGGWAINIGSLGFRIASKRRADGSWDWTTFGTGEGFTANSIVSGSLDARLIRAGILTDRAGKNSWNLDTGRLVTRDMTAWNINAENGVIQKMGANDITARDLTVDGAKMTKITVNDLNAQKIKMRDINAENLHVNGAYLEKATVKDFAAKGVKMVDVIAKNCDMMGDFTSYIPNSGGARVKIEQGVIRGYGSDSPSDSNGFINFNARLNTPGRQLHGLQIVTNEALLLATPSIYMPIGGTHHSPHTRMFTGKFDFLYQSGGKNYIGTIKVCNGMIYSVSSGACYSDPY